MRLFGWLIFFLFFTSDGVPLRGPESEQPGLCSCPLPENEDQILTVAEKEHGLRPAKGGLMSTRIQSLEELKKVIRVEYFHAKNNTAPEGKASVELAHCSDGKEVRSVLTQGISQADFSKGRDGGIWERIDLALRSPYTVSNREDLMRVFFLARRNYQDFGEGDAAFFDLAANMVTRIDTLGLPLAPGDLGEKGFLNTFNHMTAQAFLTTLFSERFADFVADAHERLNMVELITGDFTEEQLNSTKNNPVDNYVDIINNEWGQELGKELKAKYGIQRSTEWTPELLSAYLNDMLIYFSWALDLNFRPFRPKDEVVVRFAWKLNRAMGSVSELKTAS